MKNGTGLSLGVGIIIVIAALAVIFGIYVIGEHNSIVELSETVDKKYSDIDAQLERRTDLIPNLVNTVKGYMKHEEDVITRVTTARENLVKAQSVEDKAKANTELTNALNALFVIVENYPDLKADTSFTGLMDELAGTENRIAQARKEYNGAVENYNKKIKKFPTKMIASMFNFDEKSYFEVTPGKEEVPVVNFD